jgi:hypothetical protein
MALHRDHASGETTERGGVTCPYHKEVLILRSAERASRRMAAGDIRATWFETALMRLLTMRIERAARLLTMR